MGYVFKNPDGTIYLIRCPCCERENYALAVASGVCAWCLYEATPEDTQEEV